MTDPHPSAPINNPIVVVVVSVNFAGSRFLRSLVDPMSSSAPTLEASLKGNVGYFNSSFHVGTGLIDVESMMGSHMRELT
ncbi:hypothetical protein EUGRSUZ_E04342 [Eucalyptus grandis]|uniref:Uncharacterized protein n=2 Tax=Eucalyptus grandis TaxID=71139 RepID=A0ACC3L1S0_EUCGR|nr:hypothetical protein EUGRSUZ_E04342 [Eucalyptus grandis]